MNKIILTLMAASLLCVGLTACGGEASLNNPLNVEAPALVTIKSHDFITDGSPLIYGNKYTFLDLSNFK